MAQPPDYPKHPPQWLGQWPSADEVRELFPEGIRRHGYRALQTARDVQVDWVENRLTVDFRDQRVTWRLVKGKWRRFCSCGYKNDLCIHAYAAARIFQTVLSREGWLHRGGAPDGPVRAAVPAARTKARPPQLSQLELFGAAVNVNQASERRIEVEVDLRHDPENATLRFYLNEDGMRRVLRTQQVLNLGLKARHSEAARKLWNEPDHDFLRWVAPRIKQGGALRQNLQVLKIPRTELDYWMEYWAAVPGRFIERASQKPLSRSSHAARMTFELSNDGEWVRIDAMVTLPRGAPRPFHEIFRLLAGGKRELVQDGQMLDFAPPVSWDLLREVFARKSPRMRRELVCQHLPALLEDRLDLVGGPAVEHRHLQAEALVELSAAGADVLVSTRIGGAVMRRGSPAAAGRIAAAGNRFMITIYDCERAEAVKQFLAKLPPTPEEAGGALRVAGTVENMQRLVSAWPSLAAAVRTQVDPRLKTLVAGAAEIRPEVVLQDHDTFVDVGVVWRCGDLRIEADEVAQAARSDLSVFRSRSGHWLQVEPGQLADAVRGLAETGFASGEEQRHVRMAARRLLQQLQTQAGAVAGRGSRTLAQRLLAEKAPAPTALPTHLTAVLRQYQKEGFSFLSDRCAHRVGAILADDMGLGKTLQTLALLSAHLKGQDEARREETSTKGALVICPASVVGVWLEQAALFCPELRCAAYAGPAEERGRVLTKGEWDLLVTNYALARIDADELLAHTYAFVILDEAQHIKNPDSQVARAVKQLRTPHPLALTGTPLENRLLDLWSIMDFLNPDFLVDRDTFAQTYDSAEGKRSDLARRIAPMILRRTKEAVAPELPPKTQEVLHVELTEAERKIYDAELVRARAAVKAKGPMEVLAALTRLRQVCCHPDLLLKDGTFRQSSKLDTLTEMVEEILSEDHSALVFSQFTSMLALMEKALEEAGVPTLKLTGRTRTADRARLVREFNESGKEKVFLLSLRAAGTGLNLTRADYVFVYDPWWNPAVERQAIDRAHRIGQESHVFAYRLVASGTVEEKVLALQAEKAELFADVMSETERAPIPRKLTPADLAALVS